MKLIDVSNSEERISYLSCMSKVQTKQLREQEPVEWRGLIKYAVSVVV